MLQADTIPHISAAISGHAEDCSAVADISSESEGLQVVGIVGGGYE